MMLSARSLVNPGPPPPIRLNFMVIGETGSGKKTFCYSLFQKYLSEQFLPNPPPSRYQKIHIHEIGRYELETTTNQKCLVHLYDSLGYGDHINNTDSVEKIKQYLLEKHYKWLEIPGQQTTDDERAASDERIHLIFYFLSPNRLRELDREFFKALKGIANVVPVVGKSDTMTFDERQKYLLELKEMFLDLEKSCGVNIFDFQEVPNEVDGWIPSETVINLPNADEEVKSEAESVNSADSGSAEVFVETHLNLSESINRASSMSISPRVPLPKIPNVFAISSDVSGYRIYPWGTVESENPYHSDFSRLQTLIFENGYINAFRRLTQQFTSKLPPIKKSGEVTKKEVFVFILIAFVTALISFVAKHYRITANSTEVQ